MFTCFWKLLIASVVGVLDIYIDIDIYDKYHICLWKECCLLPHDSAALSQVSLSSLVPCDLTRLLKGMSHVFALCRGSY